MAAHGNAPRATNRKAPPKTKRKPRVPRRAPQAPRLRPRTPHRARRQGNPVRVDPPPLPYACSVTPAQLSRTVLQVVRRAVADGELGAVREGAELPEQVTVESPPRRGSGDYAVSVAFGLAGQAGMTPYDVARVLRDRLLREDGIRTAEIAGGGFLNVTLDARARARLVAELSHRPIEVADAGVDSAGVTAADPGAAGNPVEEDPVGDTPAVDIEWWSAVTGESPAALAVRTAQASGLFRVQYAHARTRALSRNARDLGFRGDPQAITETVTETATEVGTESVTEVATGADTDLVPEAAAEARTEPATATTPAYGPCGDALLVSSKHRQAAPKGQASANAAAAADTVVGVPRIAMTSATPSAAPTWRATELSPVAVAKSSPGAEATAAALRFGNSVPAPRPRRTIPGSHSLTNAGVVPT